MNSFKNQIEEDIREYQKNYPNIPNINKDEWAFNYWVLDKLFNEEEELIEEKIIDYNDMGVDAYEIYENTEEIYLIQNKYYSDSTPISSNYVKNDFLLRPINALENGTYTKSKELQNAFTKYKDHDDFNVYLQIYVTNNEHCIEAENYIKEFNIKYPKYHANIFYLDDIKDLYFREPIQEQKDISVKIESVNKGTILNINTTDYKLDNIIDARYVLTPVVSVYRMYRDALEKSYPIFDMNIREYLGNQRINKKIYETLLDKEERKNFFYYNNGITVICDNMSKIETSISKFNMNANFTVDNPQIVNGCQTVNSIYEALKNIDPDELEKDFKDTFVMLKILQIDRKNVVEDGLYKNIVKYNNSQNSIDEKTFEKNNEYFRRIQREFEEKGFLLLIKQSDKNTYGNKYKTITKLKNANLERIKRFGLAEPKKASDLYIPLEKLMQVVLAFTSGGYKAYVKKSNIFKRTEKGYSEEYNISTQFIINGNCSMDSLLDLYMLYKRSEQEKKVCDDKRTPISYYLIDAFAKFECEERNPKYIQSQLSDANKINRIIKLYKLVTKAYTKEYQKNKNTDYNKMIKQPVDYNLLFDQRDTFVSVIDD